MGPDVSSLPCRLSSGMHPLHPSTYPTRRDECCVRKRSRIHALKTLNCLANKDQRDQSLAMKMMYAAATRNAKRHRVSGLRSARFRLSTVSVRWRRSARYPRNLRLARARRGGATSVRRQQTARHIHRSSEACQIRALEIASSEPSKGPCGNHRAAKAAKGSSGSAAALMKSGILAKWTQGRAWRSKMMMCYVLSIR